MPLLETDFYIPYKSKGLEVLAVGLDPDESNLKRAAAPLGLSYKLLIDGTMQAVQKYKITGIPLNIIVDKKGVIRYRKSGYDPEGMKKVIDELL